ncbi:MAG: hypothetical protein DRG82_16000 [Deltaproteobacteria bacterium]|nr:MAG: hypothetical protein DRG82_16000 [Deltaproteobacteria bacterium]
MKRLILAALMAAGLHAVLLATGAGWFRGAVPLRQGKKTVILSLQYLPLPVKPKANIGKIAAKANPKPVIPPKKPIPKKRKTKKALLKPEPHPKPIKRPKPVPKPKIVHPKPKRVKPVQSPPPPQEPTKKVTVETHSARHETAPEKGSISPQQEPVTAEVVEDALADLPNPGEEKVSEETAVASAFPEKVPIVKVARPLYRKNPRPGYPRLARRRGYQGTVILEAFITRDGIPGKVRVFRSSGYRSLDKAAIRAVEKWSFEPGSKNGIPVDMWVKIPVRFQLD